MSRQPTCHSCKYWWAYEGKGEGLGNCHRRSPAPASEALTAILGIVRFRDVLFEQPPRELEQPPRERSVPPAAGDIYNLRAIWPMTLSDDGCGEHVSRNPRQGFV